LVTALGFDIGGANTKAALITADKDKLCAIEVAVEYFPVWKDPEKLTSVLVGLKRKLSGGALDGVGVTMTAELSDAYQTKREGVQRILACVKKAFPDIAIYVLNADAELVSTEVAERNPLDVAAANWAATGWLISQQLRDAVIIDVGSTSTSIIPIVNGRLAAKGKTDIDKLICGELVYTGSLRTNIAAITQCVPLKRGVSAVASELFALSGDVHLVLGHITDVEYTSETADGRGRTIPEAMTRLSRVVCADTEMLSEKEILDMAEYIYQQQVEQIVAGLNQVYKFTKTLASIEIPIVVTGLGKNFLARSAAEKVGANSIMDLDTILPKQAVVATPAFGVVLMTASKLKGESITWGYQ
jgi:probable H4MPT-linked C1 transfer pathway protein